ncbi:hypothetical protein CPC08DRAFT_714395 [Agrocybe pediades]|nr:hypothetical protein CPC08DRAFT_714395 [Agrocybe pediades]
MVRNTRAREYADLKCKLESIELHLRESRRFSSIPLIRVLACQRPTNGILHPH